jgi:hypothetical protein
MGALIANVGLGPSSGRMVGDPESELVPLPADD